MACFSETDIPQMDLKKGIFKVKQARMAVYRRSMAVKDGLQI